jgi:hypothetical protein
MKWFNDPPCYGMAVKLSDSAAGKLELIGPATSERVKGGVMAAMGATFGSFALPFFRAPFPAPFKLIPLAFTLIGGGLGTLGVAVATSEVSALFERGKGARFRWKIGPLRPRELFVPAKDIAGFEVSRRVHHSQDHNGFSSTDVTYELHLVTKAGKAVAFESFALGAQAKLRLEQVEALMSPAKPKAPRKKAAARKTPRAAKAR